MNIDVFGGGAWDSLFKCTCFAPVLPATKPLPLQSSVCRVCKYLYLCDAPTNSATEVQSITCVTRCYLPWVRGINIMIKIFGLHPEVHMNQLTLGLGYTPHCWTGLCCDGTSRPKWIWPFINIHFQAADGSSEIPLLLHSLPTQEPQPGRGKGECWEHPWCWNSPNRQLAADVATAEVELLQHIAVMVAVASNHKTGGTKAIWNHSLPNFNFPYVTLGLRGLLLVWRILSPEI